MTDLYEAMTPTAQPDLRERLDHALATIGDQELAAVIVTAGLAAVHDEWQRCRVDLAVQEDFGRALAMRIAELTDEARRWKRRWAGTVVQAQQEHARADLLRAELDQIGGAAPCWCGHATASHTTDESDSAVCRACVTVEHMHQAFHVHTPEQQP